MDTYQSRQFTNSQEPSVAAPSGDETLKSTLIDHLSNYEAKDRGTTANYLDIGHKQDTD